MKYKTRQRIKLNSRQLLENKNKKTRKQRGGSLLMELAIPIGVIIVILVLIYIIDKLFALVEIISEVIESYTDHRIKQNFLREGYTFDKYNRLIPPVNPTPEQLKLTAKRKKREKAAKDMEERAKDREKRKAEKKDSAKKKVGFLISKEATDALDKEKGAKAMGYKSFSEMKNTIYTNSDKSAIDKEVNDAFATQQHLNNIFDEAVHALSEANNNVFQAAERAAIASNDQGDADGNIILLKAAAAAAKEAKEKAGAANAVAMQAWMDAKLKETAWNAADAEAKAEVPPLDAQVEAGPANNAVKLMSVKGAAVDDDFVNDKATDTVVIKSAPGRYFPSSRKPQYGGETGIAADDAAEEITSTLATAVLNAKASADTDATDMARQVLSDNSTYADTADEGKLVETYNKIKKVCFILKFIPSSLCSFIFRIIIIPIIFKNCSDARAFSEELCIFFKTYDRTTDTYTQFLQLNPLYNIMKQYGYKSNPDVTLELSNMISEIETKPPAETLNKLREAINDNKLDGSRNTKYKFTLKLPKMSKFFKKFRLYRAAPLTVDMASAILNDPAETSTVLQEIANEVTADKEKEDESGASGGGQKHSKKNKTSKKIRRMQKKSKFNIL